MIRVTSLFLYNLILSPGLNWITFEVLVISRWNALLFFFYTTFFEIHHTTGTFHLLDKIEDVLVEIVFILQLEVED